MDIYGFSDAMELCLVLDVVIPHKFNIPNFEKYDGTKCQMAYITMYYQKMATYTHDDKLLVHCFLDNLIRSIARWYVQLDNDHIHSWKDLARAFIAQCKHFHKYDFE